MSYIVHKMAPCKRCGEPTNRRERNTRDPLCLECALIKAADAISEMRERSGPVYDKWRIALKRAMNS
jgi:hypothetical protein